MTAQPHDIPNADLLERIPLSAQVVLDVGCSTGALSAAYRRFSGRRRQALALSARATAE